jgi:hypothetical protein
VVGLTQVLGAQHDPVVAVLPHPPIVAYPADRDGPPRTAGSPSSGYCRPAGMVTSVLVAVLT